MTAYANKFAMENGELKMENETEFSILNSQLSIRILNQMARELLLAESSDWAFQIYQGTTVEYSSRRFQSHIQRFNMLAKMLDDLIPHPSSLFPQESLDLLAEIESRDNIFAEIDYRVYQS